MATHRYMLNGPTDPYLEQYLGAGVIAGGPVAPVAHALRELDDEGLLTDLDSLMAQMGFVRDDASLELPPSLLRLKRVKLSADASAISPTAFATVLSVDITTRGGSTLQIRGCAVAGVIIGGSTRIVIDGGTFADQVLLFSNHAALGNSLGGGDTFVSIPSTENDVTYTVTVECAASLLGSVTPRAGSALIVEEYI